jgi:coenzyme PQQ precursor peptide PqqA
VAFTVFPVGVEPVPATELPRRLPTGGPIFPLKEVSKRSFAMWTKPEYTEMRFGFEVTMYIANR